MNLWGWELKLTEQVLLSGHNSHKDVRPPTSFHTYDYCFWLVWLEIYQLTKWCTDNVSMCWQCLCKARLNPGLSKPWLSSDLKIKRLQSLSRYSVKIRVLNHIFLCFQCNIWGGALISTWVMLSQIVAFCPDWKQEQYLNRLFFFYNFFNGQLQNCW